jgi:hypothetical protein
MVRQFNLLESIYLSFYSKRLYRDVSSNWGGYAILYLLMILTLSWIGATWKIQTGLALAYRQNANWMVTQIPDLKIKDGKISTPINRPYIIYEPYSKNKIAIIDTSGKYKTIEEAGVNVLVTENQVIAKNINKNETRIIDIPKTVNWTINPIVINGYISTFVGYLWIPIFIFCILVSFLYRIIQALLYALFGKIFNYFSGANLSYGQIMQIAMVAVTPAIVIETICSVAGWHFMRQPLLFFILSMLYVCYGIIANKSGKSTVGYT